MQDVSNAYITAIRRNDRPYDEVYGTITFDDNTTLTVNSSNIPSNELKWIRQCIDGEDLEVGGVYLGSIEMSLLSDKSRYAFYGARLELDYKIDIGGSYEVVHIGKFTISSAERPSKNKIKFKAYDNMLLLDTQLGSTVLQGTPYIILSQISSATGMALAFDSAYVTQNFVNTDVQMQLSKDSDITTYREAVKCVCQALGCFAQDNREGKMELRRYSQEVDCTLTTGDFYSALVSDYISNYVALSVTGLKGTYTAVSTDPDEVGNLFTIEDAPAWDFGVFATLQNMTNNLFNYLHTLAYTPVEIEMPSDVAFDCGDRIEIVTDNGDTIETLITSYEWKWHGGMTIESKGKNPYLSGGSASDIKTSRLVTRTVEDSKIYMWHFTNPTEVTASDGGSERLIGKLRFSSSADTDAMFVDTIQTVVTTESVCRATITYSLNGVIYDYQAIDDLTEGKHIISLNYPITGLVAGDSNVWEVYLSAEGGDITLPEQTMKATIWGQGLRDLDIWYGLFEMEDEYEPLVGGQDIVGLSDVIVSLDTDLPYPNIHLEDEYEHLVGGQTIVALSDNMSITREKEQFYLVTEDGDNLATEDGDTLIT